MSPSENKRAKRRKNKKGRPINHGECLETHPKEKDEKVTLNNVDDSKVSSKSMSQPFRPCHVFSDSKQCMCQCEQTQCQENTYELEQGSGESGDENGRNSSSVGQIPLWVCSDRQNIAEEQQEMETFDPNFDYMPGTRDSSSYNIDPGAGVGDSIGEERMNCHCDTCKQRRFHFLLSTEVSVPQSECFERTVEPEQEQEQQELRNCWLELKRAVHQLYREAGLSLGETLSLQQVISSYKENCIKLQTPQHLKDLLHRLCEQDPHKLFQCLQAQVYLFIVEMRLRLLRHLVSGKSISGKSFVHTMLEEYAKLCSASKHISPILQELETMHLKKFNITWELVNRYLFQSIVYSDPVLHSSLPEVSRGNNSMNGCDNDSTSLVIKLDDEMAVISVVWKEAQQLIQEYSKEQAVVRGLFNSQWTVSQEDIFNKSSIRNNRCTCEECCNNRRQSTESLTSTFLTAAELTSMAENRDSQSLDIIESNLLMRECAIQKNHLKSAVVSSVTSTHNGSCRECFQSVGILNDKCYSTSPKQAAEAPSVVGIPVNHVNDASSMGKLSICPIMNGSSRRMFSSEYNVSVSAHHPCCHNNGMDRNTTLSDSHARLPEHRVFQSLCQGQNTVGLNSIYNNSIPSVSVPLNTFSLATNPSNNLSLQEINVSSNPKSYWQSPLEDEIIREQGTEISTNMITGSGTIEAKPCECHSCTKLKETLTIPNAPIVPSLLPVSHSQPALPIFTHLTDMTQNNTQPLIHPHLYNLQVGKGNINSSQLTKSPHSPWSIDLDREERIVLKQQMYVAQYGEWDNKEDSRSLMNFATYGDFLTNRFLCPRSSHLPQSPVINNSIGVPGRRKLGCGSSSIATHIELEMKDEHFSPISHTPANHLSSSVSATSCSGTAYCHSPIKSSGAKRHRHASDSLCTAHSQTINGDAYSTGKTGIQSINNISLGTNKEQQISSRSVHTSTTISDASVTQSSVLDSQHNQNDYQSVVSTMSCYDDAECENHLPEGEESVDDSCSEQSSSTSASNQRESRVCDCCYCEVFGHGVPAVAPVSKNYPEMRDRLRLRLSKRKAETNGSTVNKSQDTLGPAVDERELEELLNFINGSDNSQNKSKTAKRQKKKKKAEEKIVKQLENFSLQSEEIYKSSNIYKDAKYELSDVDCENENSSEKKFSIKPEYSKEIVSKNEMSDKILINGNRNKQKELSSPVKNEIIIQKVSPNLCKEKNGAKINLSSNSQVNIQSITNGKNSITITPFNEIQVTKGTTEKLKNSENYSFQLNSSVGQQIITISENKDNLISQIRPSSNEKFLHCLINNEEINCEPAETIEQITNQNTKILSTVQGLQESNGTLCQNSKPSVRSKKNKKKKNCVDDTTSPDEVFLPKDIDLENGELDELEKELEAFKRFCFNSVPLEHKEKVNVNLKDIVLKKKSQYGLSGTNFSGSSQNQRC